MVTIYVDLRKPATLKRLKNYRRQLLFTTDVSHKAVVEANTRLVRDFIKSAKLRAPRWTGYLASTIKLDKRVITKQKSLLSATVDAPYAVFQEQGYTPHMVGASALTRNPFGGKRYFANWMADKGISGPGARVSRFTPFIAPAFFQTAAKVRSLYTRKVGTALKKHFR